MIGILSVKSVDDFKKIDVLNTKGYKCTFLIIKCFVELNITKLL